MVFVIFFALGCEKNRIIRPTNSAPSVPSPLLPTNGSSDQAIDIKLNWSCSDPEDDPLRYDVYFGETLIEGLNTPHTISKNQDSTTYLLPYLNHNTQYFWRVVARDNSGNTSESDLWTFTTRGYLPGEALDFELIDDVKITMVWIPPGSFMMGSGYDEDGEDFERPRHEVTFENGFWMGKYEVTQSQWKAVAGDEYQGRWYDSKGENHAVHTISWDEIQSEFLTQTVLGYRLPSEAEWEYACRAGTETRFYWGNDPEYRHIYDYCSFGGSRIVGTKLPNEWGLHDMSGNVWELCEDHWHRNYKNAPDDGSPWIDEGDFGDRVRRGGAFDMHEWYHRSAQRGYSWTDYHSDCIGFRLVLDR